jgi:hypothetical protein
VALQRRCRIGIRALKVRRFDDGSGDMLEAVNRRVCLKDPVVRRMRLENAEITINSCVMLKISFANTIAALCERVPGGNIYIVSEAPGSDSRIGRTTPTTVSLKALRGEAKLLVAYKPLSVSPKIRPAFTRPTPWPMRDTA